MKHSHTSWRSLLTTASLLFGLFFGAGNLIFPLHLGQLAGKNWLPAAVGFLITGALLPLFSVLAIALTDAEGVYDVAKPLGPVFALTFMILVHLAIGPAFGTPRTATVAFTVGVAPFLSHAQEKVGLLIFSALFFTAAFAVSYHENKIATQVGKLLNPLFLGLLFLVFLVCFLNPLGRPSTAPVSGVFQHSATLHGFLEGYATMDTLAGLAFGVTVVRAIKQMGVKTQAKRARLAARAGLLSQFLVAVIYLLLILVGAQSLGQFKPAANGGVAFSQIVQHYAGNVGQAVLATLLTLTCLTTAVGLVAAFAQDFHTHMPKLSYHQWLALNCLACFVFANFGLDQIIAWSQPFLMLLYPLAIVLTTLAICGRWFNHAPVVYWTTMLAAGIPAGLEMLAAMPRLHFNSPLPGADANLSWLLPALAGAVISLVVWRRQQRVVA